MSQQDLLEALSALRVSPSLITEAEKQMLDELGYLPLPGILDAATVAALARRFDELVLEEGDQAGLEAHQEDGTSRLANLVDKGRFSTSAGTTRGSWRPSRTSLGGRISRCFR